MTRVFIHSWHGDFAKTRVASELEYLGRAVTEPATPFRLFDCGCGTRHLQRIQRPFWMRAVIGFRLYSCARCKCRVLRPRTRQRWPYLAGY